MKKNVNNEVKANVASGASSAIGAAVGVVAGSILSNALHAEEVVDVPMTNDIEDDEDIEVLTTEPSDVDVIQSTPSTEEPEVRVIAYETVETDSGDEVDMALVDVDGQSIVFSDIDQDGQADLAYTDLNGNGEMDEGELVDVSEYDLPMDSLPEAIIGENNHQMAQTADIDYTNDANVDAYYA